MTPRFATLKQRRYLRDLAARAGVEVPQVVFRDDAAAAIKQLEVHIRDSAQLRLLR